jgi:hypothetical protein
LLRSAWRWRWRSCFDDRLTAVRAGVTPTVAILLIRPRICCRAVTINALIVANMASVQFQRIAFHRAFGTTETDNEARTMANITTAEMLAIQRMMGAQLGGIDPFPITKSNRLNLEVLPEDLFETQEFEVPEELRRDGEGGPE